MKVNDYSKAELMFKKAIKHKERALGTCHVSTAHSYEHYAVACLLPQKKFKECDTYFDKAMNIVSTVCGESHYSNGILKRNKAVCLIKQGGMDEAEILLSEAVKLLSKHYDLDHYLIADLKKVLQQMKSDKELDHLDFAVHLESVSSEVSEGMSFDIRTLSPELLQLLRDAGVTDEMLQDPAQIEMIFTSLMETLSETKKEDEEEMEEEEDDDDDEPKVIEYGSPMYEGDTKFGTYLDSDKMYFEQNDEENLVLDGDSDKSDEALGSEDEIYMAKDSAVIRDRIEVLEEKKSEKKSEKESEKKMNEREEEEIVVVKEEKRKKSEKKVNELEKRKEKLRSKESMYEGKKEEEEEEEDNEEDNFGGNLEEDDFLNDVPSLSADVVVEAPKKGGGGFGMGSLKNLFG